MPRVLAFGDIHGCLLQLDALLGAVDVKADDRLVFLGDYVDRGPDSSGVLKRLLQLSGQLRDRVTFIKGNHEQMMIEASSGREQFVEWFVNGGDATLASYAGSRGTLRDVIPEHWRFLENRLVDYLETRTHIFVHASASPELEMKDQPDFMLRWERFDEIAPHESGKIIVCGHTPQTSGEPISRGYAICIDTHACGKIGLLTCMDASSGKIWQADRAGAIGRSHISDFE